MSDSPLTPLARNEIVALHEFFVGWFRGELAEAAFGACEAAFAPDFSMVHPDGVRHRLDEILARLRAARGQSSQDFTIAVHDVSSLWSAGEHVLVEYIEQQYRDGRETRRRSTALFTIAPTAPRGVQWRHLQETWIS